MPAAFLEGVLPMKTHIRYRDLSERRLIEREMRRQRAKLERQLKKYDPDLVDLHVSVERYQRPRSPFAAGVTLRLPQGQLHASYEAGRPVIALKHACAELHRELKRLKARLQNRNGRRVARRTRRLLIT